MHVHLWSLLVWALVGASAVYWGLQVWARPPALPPASAVVAPADGLQVSLAKLGGSEGNAATGALPAGEAPAPVPGDGRFALRGVVSPPAAGTLGAGPTGGAESVSGTVPAGSSTGLALISVDGKPPRAYAVGATVEAGLVLLSVSRRAASLGPAASAAQTAHPVQPGQNATVQLTIPEPAPPLRGRPAPP